MATTYLTACNENCGAPFLALHSLGREKGTLLKRPIPSLGS